MDWFLWISSSERNWYFYFVHSSISVYWIKGGIFQMKLHPQTSQNKHFSSQDQWFRNSETHRKHVFHSFHGNISLAQTGPSEAAWQSVSAATLLLETQLIFWVSGRGATWEEPGRPPSSPVGPFDFRHFDLSRRAWWRSPQSHVIRGVTSCRN